MSKAKYLLDVNMLIALLDQDHVHHVRVLNWFSSSSRDWGVCAFSEAGFLRVATNPKTGMFSIEEASEALDSLVKVSGYRFWPITSGWTSLAEPFYERMFGHQQVTDAYLLGLAVKEDGVLVTMDKSIRYLAGQRYSRNLLVLE